MPRTPDRFGGRREEVEITNITSFNTEGLYFTGNLTNGNASPITQGMVVYISNSLTVDKALANSLNSSNWYGIVTSSSIAPSSSGSIAFDGVVVIPNSRQSGETWSYNDRIYVSPSTAGDLTKIVPNSSGTFVAEIGICINTPGGGDAIVALHRKAITAN